MSTATLDQAKHFLTLVSQKRVPEEQLQALFRSGLFADLLDAHVDVVDRNKFRKVLGLNPLEFRITVDYSLSLEQMIEAGNYDECDTFITSKRFIVRGTGTQKLVGAIIRLGYVCSFGGLITELKKAGYRLATIAELLAFGAAFPEEQRKSQILAMEDTTAIDGCSYAAKLRGNATERALDFGDVSKDWHWGSHYKFLVFPREVF